MRTYVKDPGQLEWLLKLIHSEHLKEGIERDLRNKDIVVIDIHKEPIIFLPESTNPNRRKRK